MSYDPVFASVFDLDDLYRTLHLFHQKEVDLVIQSCKEDDKALIEALRKLLPAEATLDDAIMMHKDEPELSLLQGDGEYGRYPYRFDHTVDRLGDGLNRLQIAVLCGSRNTIAYVLDELGGDAKLSALNYLAPSGSYYTGLNALQMALIYRNNKCYVRYQQYFRAEYQSANAVSDILRSYPNKEEVYKVLNSAVPTDYSGRKELAIDGISFGGLIPLHIAICGQDADTVKTILDLYPKDLSRLDILNQLWGAPHSFYGKPNALQAAVLFSSHDTVLTVLESYPDHKSKIEAFGAQMPYADMSVLQYAILRGKITISELRSIYLDHQSLVDAIRAPAESGSRYFRLNLLQMILIDGKDRGEFYKIRFISMLQTILAVCYATPKRKNRVLSEVVFAEREEPKNEDEVRYRYIGLNALQIAVLGGDANVIHVILQAYPDDEARIEALGSPVSIGEWAGLNALQIAIGDDNEESVKTILAAYPDDEARIQALHAPIAHGSEYVGKRMPELLEGFGEDKLIKDILAEIGSSPGRTLSTLFAQQHLGPPGRAPSDVSAGAFGR